MLKEKILPSPRRHGPGRGGKGGSPRGRGPRGAGAALLPSPEHDRREHRGAGGKRAYLEKRYGDIGKLADQGELAEMEPEDIPLE